MIWRLLPLAAFIGLAVLLFAGIQLSKERPADRLPSALIGKPAPEFALAGLRENEGEIASTAFLGRPWLLNVWASWCAGCRIEHPLIEALSRELDIPIVGLNWKDERDDARRWLAAYGDPYDAVATDPENRVGIHYGVYGAPETFVIDAKGVIRHKFVGPLTEQDIGMTLLPLLARLDAESGA